MPFLAADEPPRIVTPAPNEVSFGRVVVDVPSGTRRVIVLVDGKPLAERATLRTRVTIRVNLPRRDVSLRAVAFDAAGARLNSRRVGPVLGLPARGAPRPSGSRADAVLTRAVKRHVAAFPGVSAVYVRDLASGAGASWNATAQFPAGSTLKVALALEAMRVTNGPPPPGSRLRTLLDGMLLDSSNIDTNALAVEIAGSTGAASANVNALMAGIGLTDSDLFGGYLVEDDELRARGLAQAPGVPRERPKIPPEIPLTTTNQPQLERGKRTSAADLGRLFSAIHLAAGGRGPLIQNHRGEITPAEARHLLFLLTHTKDQATKLGAGVNGATVAHKAGWISTARHDAGIVYWKGGAFVIAAMTWNAAGVGTASDLFATRIARTALNSFRD